MEKCIFLDPLSLKSSSDQMNVYMFGFDSISRLIAMRKLPKMLKFLTEEMDAVLMEGYNIVGDGTPQALIPILTGCTEMELPMTRRRMPRPKFVDVYPFIWNNFSRAGYVTLYGEDAAKYGTFTYRLTGFDQQPTDHYRNPLNNFKNSEIHLFIYFYCILKFIS